MRKPLEDLKIFRERRARVASLMGDGALIVSAPLERIRNGSVHYPFHQDSNLYYLTGWEEPESILVFRPGKTPETTLFVRKKDSMRETWDGFRFGPEGATNQFGIEAAHTIEEFDQKIAELLKGCSKLYYKLFKNEKSDDRIRSALLGLQQSQGRTGFGLLSIHDADELIGQARLIKSEADAEKLRKAGELSSAAHVELMKMTKPGVNERELHGQFIYQIMKRGAAREGYGSIIASGANACTLHYVFNDQVCKDGDLLLVDAGGEYNYFTADITRCYPVNGKFSEAQAEIYSMVLEIQKTIIERVKPGLTFKELQDMGTEMLTDMALKLGFLTGRREDIIKAGDHKRYYPHGIGHFLGMDVHDAGLYFSKSMEPRKIEAGMVFTIEPGFYIPVNDSGSPSKYHGIGVRIEDNILVTNTGFEVLTKNCPKEIAELEKIIGTN